MNILIDIVPDTVEIDGIDYSIDTNFRTGILFELLMQDRSLTTTEKVATALNLYYPKLPPNILEATNKIMWFYMCGESTDTPNNTDESYSRPQQIYSFEHDAELIYAAFMTQYDINLQTIDYLHWWEFRALFRGLDESNKIVEVMSIRSMQITKNMTKEQRNYYRKMKELYKLPDNRTEEEKEIEFHQELSLF